MPVPFGTWTSIPSIVTVTAIASFSVDAAGKRPRAFQALRVLLQRALKQAQDPQVKQFAQMKKLMKQIARGKMPSLQQLAGGR
jgi:hypothetical protein